VNPGLLSGIRAFLAELLLLPVRLLLAIGIAPRAVRFVAHLAYLMAGGEALRYRFDLDRQSLVMDLGGYKGHFALEILKQHECRIWIFEALPPYAARLQRRLGRIPGLRIFPYGLAGVDQKASIHVDEDASSTFEGPKESRSVRIRLRSATAFLAAARPRQVDLMKINIEGGEYELLERLLESPWSRKIVRLQVQFHPFVPGALGRMKAIQAQLGRTHVKEWGFPMVWESWVLKETRA
jgi:FkbM family methyltransferase